MADKKQMKKDLPPPLVPPEVDLRDVPFPPELLWRLLEDFHRNLTLQKSKKNPKRERHG